MEPWILVLAMAADCNLLICKTILLSGLHKKLVAMVSKLCKLYFLYLQCIFLITLKCWLFLDVMSGVFSSPWQILISLPCSWSLDLQITLFAQAQQRNTASFQKRLILPIRLQRIAWFHSAVQSKFLVLLVNVHIHTWGPYFFELLPSLTWGIRLHTSCCTMAWSFHSSLIICLWIQFLWVIQQKI